MALPIGRALPGPLKEAVDRFDVAADRWFDHLRGRPGADHLFYGASELGDFSLIWLLLGSAQGLRDDVSFQRAVRLGLALGVESALVNGLLKSITRRDRPTRVGPIPRKLRMPRTSSFPSGHASSAFAATTLLSDGEGPVLTCLYHATAAVVASSRVYVKIHFASDVVAGALLGLAYGRWVKRTFPLPPDDAPQTPPPAMDRAPDPDHPTPPALSATAD